MKTSLVLGSSIIANSNLTRAKCKQHLNKQKTTEKHNAKLHQETNVHEDILLSEQTNAQLWKTVLQEQEVQELWKEADPSFLLPS